MITSGMLVIALQYDRSGTLTIVPNLADVAECQRVAQVIRDADFYRNLSTRCVQVIHKRGA